MTLHQLVSSRAMTYAAVPSYPAFIPLLLANLGSLQAGAPYPDYLYQCGSNHDDGEYTHWSGFQAAAANYIRAAYPAPRNATGDALVAFVTGVVSHYFADIVWHGLAETPSGYGLIETIGGLDFGAHGDLNSTAHTLADLGGEYVSVFQDETGAWDDPTTWVVPTDDLLAIYASVNRTDVTAAAINQCAALFYAGTLAIAATAATEEPTQITTSPTIGESMFDMPVGGVDDMAVGSTRLWARWASWVDRGPPVPVPGNEYPSAGVPPPSRAALVAKQRLLRTLGRPLLEQGLVRTTVEGGVTRISRAPGVTPADVLEPVVASLRSSATRTVRGSKPRAGASWTEPHPDDAANPAVAAFLRSARLTPTRGLGEKAPTPRSLLPLPPPADPIAVLSSTVRFEYAGAALTVGDFTGSGARGDLVVSAHGRGGYGLYSDDAEGLPSGVGTVPAVLPQAHK